LYVELVNKVLEYLLSTRVSVFIYVPPLVLNWVLLYEIFHTHNMVT